MPASLPLTTFISNASSKLRKHRTLSAQFGDGYSQEAPDGVNYKYDEWNIVYQNLTAGDRNTLWATLDAVGSWDYVNWQAVGDTTSKKWKITTDGITETIQAGNLYTITFKLRQIF